MSLQLISPPQVEPVSLAEVKQYLRLDLSDASQDDVLAGLIVAARSWAETYTARRFITQTWQLGMDFFPGYIDLKLSGSKVSSPFVSGSNAVLVGIRYAIVLPFPPIQSIVSFTYLNANGTTTVMDPATDYVTDMASNPARLTPIFGQMWPVARVVVNAVQVQFSCGYAQPVQVSLGAGQKNITGAEFLPGQIGQPISIPGAGFSGGNLNTIIAAVNDLGIATLRDAAALEVDNVTAIANLPNAPAGIAEKVRLAIRLLVNHWFENRLPDDNDIPKSVKVILMNVRDLRH